MRGRLTFGAGVVGPTLIAGGWADAASANPSWWAWWAIGIGILLTVIAVVLFVEHRGGWSVVTKISGNRINVNSGNRTETNFGQSIKGWFNRTVIHVYGGDAKSERPERRHRQRREIDRTPPPRKVSVTLFPSSGEAAMLRLGVRNDGPLDTFEANCRVFERRHTNGAALGTYEVARQGGGHQAHLRTGQTKNLDLAIFELDPDGVGRHGNVRFGQIKLVQFNTGRGGYEPFTSVWDDTLWEMRKGERLPEFGLAITILTHEPSTPRESFFKLTPEKHTGPLMLVPLKRESLDAIDG